MLELVVGGTDSFDEEADSFVTVGGRTIQLEHSLVSLSKWESKFEKPFLGAGEHTTEETIAYVQCAILTPDFSPEDFSTLTMQNLEDINTYINTKQTATIFTGTSHNKPNREVVTSELIYYWMIAFQIPFECQHWYLNRLMTLIQVCQVKTEEQNAKQSGKKLTRAEAMTANQQRAKLNAERRAQLNSTG